MNAALIAKWGSRAAFKFRFSHGMRPEINRLRAGCACDGGRLNSRSVSTVEAKSPIAKSGVLEGLLSKIPFFNVNKAKLMACGYLLYEEVADKVDYVGFFEELDLPDTFYSWFVITELHVWMLSARVMAEGDDGKLLRNFMIEALWKDVMQRVKKLGAHNPSVAKLQIGELSEQLQAALIAYDEGLHGDDFVLAGALWRRFYQQTDVDPMCLDILVRFVRKQMQLLDHLSTERLLADKTVKWCSLK